MPDFWRRSGYHLLAHDERGHLVATDDFLRAYLDRPELRPIEASCAAEIALHCELIETPRLPVPTERLAAVADPDARDNYRAVLGLRDALLAHGTVEACYLALVRDAPAPDAPAPDASPPLPPLFLDHLVQVILRNILDDCDDPLRLRAAELLFRTQRVTVSETAVLLADEETLEMRAAASAPADALLGGRDRPERAVELDVLTGDNLASYWQRSDRYDTAFDVGLERFGLDALARVLEAWVRTLLGVGVAIQPVKSIRDDRWRWHIGLDAEATAILNDLYQGREVEETRLYRILALFRLDIENQTAVLPEMAGRPVYLGMAMTESGRLRLKPQNLLVNLPLTAAG